MDIGNIEGVGNHGAAEVSPSSGPDEIEVDMKKYRQTVRGTQQEIQKQAQQELQEGTTEELQKKTQQGIHKGKPFRESNRKPLRIH